MTLRIVRQVFLSTPIRTGDVDRSYPSENDPIQAEEVKN